MAVRLVELISSRHITQGDGAGRELIYRASGSASSDRVLGEVILQTPLAIEGLTRSSIEVTPEVVDTILNTGTHLVTVRYVEPAITTQSFDTTGGQFHLTQSLQTMDAVSGSSTFPPPFNDRAIGATKDRVEGVDITVPIFTFSESYQFPAATITPSYRGKIFRLTGRVNDKVFRGFAPGECLFLGAVGSTDQKGRFNLEYRFAASPDEENIEIGDSIIVPFKSGWDYLWVRYFQEVDEDTDTFVSVPEAAYVERVYKEGDFSELGLGTGLVPTITVGSP